MIEILLALQIMYDTPKDIYKVCGALACTQPTTHQIWMGTKDEFTLYHEIGHNLYFDNKPTNNGIMSDQQTIADDFAWYIIAKKYPNKYIDSTKYWTNETFYKSIVRKEIDKMFRKTCGSKCIKEVIMLADFKNK